MTPEAGTAYGTRHKIALIAALVIVNTGLHYNTNFHHGPLHDLLQRCYYVPVVLGGLWFGVKGGLLTAFLIAIVYIPHIIEGWSAPYGASYRFMEVGMYFLIGALTGALSSRIRHALESETSARREQQRAFERLREKTEELFAVEEQLRRSDRLAALGRLSAGLAHEIRNPLASIKTTVEILRDEKMAASSAGTGGTADQDGIPDFHQVLLEEADRLDRTLTNFLDFARAEDGASSAEPGWCNVASALDKTLDLLSHQMARQNVSLERAGGSMDAEVGVSEAQLRQVFLNLLLNSLEAMPSGGVIRIGSPVREKGYASLVIDDSGPGIPAELAGRVFDPFFSTKSGGTGLGLSIVERIITHYGGSIALEHDGKKPSSRFVLRLPEWSSTARGRATTLESASLHS